MNISFIVVIRVMIQVWSSSDRKSFLSEFIFSLRAERENPKSLLFLHCWFLCTDPSFFPSSLSCSLYGRSSLAGPILTQRALQTQSDKYLLKSFPSKIHGKPWSGCKEKKKREMENAEGGMRRTEKPKNKSVR